MTEKIYRAGVIPFIIENEEIEMLFMRPSSPEFGGDSLQIAKGRRDIGEDDLTAALREGHEELGLIKENIEEIIDLGNHLGRTRFYLTKVKDKKRFTEPHFETKETQWLSEKNCFENIREIHRPVVRLAVNKIKEELLNNKDGSVLI